MRQGREEIRPLHTGPAYAWLDPRVDAGKGSCPGLGCGLECGNELFIGLHLGSSPVHPAPDTHYIFKNTLK